MNLVCDNEKCRSSFNDIDVLKGWDAAKMRAGMEAVGGDKEKLREHQEAAAERGSVCPECQSKMSRNP
jgi:hypothetical protein